LYSVKIVRIQIHKVLDSVQNVEKNYSLES